MRTHSFVIAFDDEPRIDRVTLAVAPMDAFSGEVVRQGVKAKVAGLDNKPIRNLSGLLVFINLPEQPVYNVIVQASAAGYFDPEPRLFQPPEPNDPDVIRKRRLVVPLLRLPSSSFDAETTLVRGAVVRDRLPVADARIAAVLPVRFDSSQSFETRSDARGAFALPLRLPPVILAEQPAQVSVTLRFEADPDSREFDVALVDGRTHSLAEPVDIAGTNRPPLVDPLREDSS